MDLQYEKQVGQTIRQIRKEKGLTQDSLAAKLQVLGCDITRSALAKIEVGQRHIYPDELKALRQVLKTDYDTLLK